MERLQLSPGMNKSFCFHGRADPPAFASICGCTTAGSCMMVATSVLQFVSKMGVEHDHGNDAPELLGATAFKPKERFGMDRYTHVLYDKENGEICTRTPKSWALITIFYLIYYTCLAAFWYGMLMIFFTTLPEGRPKWIKEESVIGTNPGLGMRPEQPDITIDSSIIFLKANVQGEKPSRDFESTSNIDWAKRYERYLKGYTNVTQRRNCGDEAYGEMEELGCIFDTSVLAECGTFPYGYEITGTQEVVSPCILLKLNRVYGWVPQPYEDIDAEEDPEDPVPESVRELVAQNPNQIYVNCIGENPADVEALDGNVQYFPENRGIPFKYFPFNQPSNQYHSPVVAVKFSNFPLGQLIHIECKAWAKGIKHDRKDRIGLFHLEILLDH
eukprot:maker-scaffold67_size430214-snap-gene-3.32 protein:Tk00796 transcript:maker-scaffold67_size430214-snap-gene-3.32-mRNA-1 annotation:"hypothetical protein KGM_07765"